MASLERWRRQKWQKSVVSFVSGDSDRFANDTTDLLPTCYGLVGDKSVTSWQLPRLLGSYEETGVMDFGLIRLIACSVLKAAMLVACVLITIIGSMCGQLEVTGFDF